MWAGLCIAGGVASGASIPVPNGSFESPVTPFVIVFIEGWQKSPKPGWFDETGGFLWEQLTGLFKNPVPGSSDYIENCDGAQAAWLFAVPEVALFLDQEAAPGAGFDARYETGKAYQLTVGVIGMGGNMLEGVPLELSLYYRDGAGDAVNVAATVVTNSAAMLGNRTRFVEFTVRTPEVKPDDPWAGQHVGIGFRSLVSFEMQGGFWDLDNVRLESVESFGPPVIGRPAWSEGQFQATIVSDPGSTVEVLATTDLARPVLEWRTVATLTNETGEVRFTDAEAGAAAQFYQARRIP